MSQVNIMGVILGALIVLSIGYLVMRLRQSKNQRHNRRNVGQAPQTPVVDTVVIEEDVRLIEEPVLPEVTVVEPVVMMTPKVAVVSAPVPTLTPAVKSSHLQNTLISVSVMASTGHLFSSYDLLQAITNAGFHFGEMSIFHHHQDFEGNGKALFSLASAVKPGIFNLDNIGAFATPGLTLFMDAGMHADPKSVFLLMLDCANQLADELQGELCESPTRGWSLDAFRRAEQVCQEVVLEHGITV